MSGTGDERYVYLFPYEKIPCGSKILIYGAGILGQEYLKQIQLTKYCKIVGFIDQNYDKYSKLVIPIYPPARVRDLSFDKVVIALRNDHALPEVKRTLLHYGVPEQSLVYVFQRNTALVRISAPSEEDYSGMQYAFDKSSLAIALYMVGGFGDAIIQKKFVECLISLLPDAMIDIFHSHASAYLPHLYSNVAQVNKMIDDAGGLYMRLQQRYDVSITVRGYFLHVDYLDKTNHLKNEKIFLEKIVLLQKRCTQENVSLNTPPYVGFMRRVIKGDTCYTGYSYDGVFDILDDKVDIPVDQDYYQQFQDLHIHNYITVNYGNGDSKDIRLVAKSWPLSCFDATVEMFKRRYPKIQVIQLGDRKANKIQYVDKYILGANFELVKFILKNALFHLDIEGGLVHLATQLGTKCVVLFGPTNEAYVGYKQNINIKVGSCHNCYGMYTDINCCARGMEKPECMYSITPEMVMERVEKYLTSILDVKRREIS